MSRYLLIKKTPDSYDSVNQRVKKGGKSTRFSNKLKKNSGRKSSYPRTRRDRESLANCSSMSIYVGRPNMFLLRKYLNMTKNGQCGFFVIEDWVNTKAT